MVRNAYCTSKIVYPELSSKLDTILNYGLLSMMIGGLLINTLLAFNVYFDSSIAGILGSFGQALLLVIFICSFVRWMQVIAAKQNVKFVHFRKPIPDRPAGPHGCHIFLQHGSNT